MRPSNGRMGPPRDTAAAGSEPTTGSADPRDTGAGQEGRIAPASPARRAHIDISRERRRTYEAARTLHGIEPLDLVTLAEERAGIAPVRDIDVRDFVQEAREEFADGRNYLVWIAAQVDRGAHLNLARADLIRAKVIQALGGTALVYELVEQIRELMTGWVRP